SGAEAGWPARLRSTPTSVPGLPYHVAGDHQLLDLSGSFVDAEQAHIAIKAFDGIISHVARAAMDLHGPVRHQAAHPGLEEHAARGGRRDVVAVTPRPRGVQHHAARGINLGRADG